MKMGRDILSDIVAHKRIEVQKRKEKTSLDVLLKSSHYEGNTISVRNALAGSSTGIIAEFKRKSPSKGWIFQTAEALEIPFSYQEAGASALSILTDEMYFGGSSEDLETARSKVQLPILRKDFIIDEYQIYEAKSIGADAILLIAAVLSPTDCKHLARKARELNLEVLLEIHSEKEMNHLNEYVDMIGVNNRNLGTFHTDVRCSFELAKHLPNEMLWVSESGISDPHTVSELRSAGYGGFLMGECFMKTADPGASLRNFIQRL